MADTKAETEYTQEERKLRTRLRIIQQTLAELAHERKDTDVDTAEALWGICASIDGELEQGRETPPDLRVREYPA